MSSSDRSSGICLCPMCFVESPNLPMALSHLRLVHGNDPRFCVQCGIGGCSYTGRSFSALYSHIYRKRKGCGVIHKRGEPVVVQPNARVTESHTGTTDTEHEPDSASEQLQG